MERSNILLNEQLIIWPYPKQKGDGAKPGPAYKGHRQGQARSSSNARDEDRAEQTKERWSKGIIREAGHSKCHPAGEPVCQLRRQGRSFALDQDQMQSRDPEKGSPAIVADPQCHSRGERGKCETNTGKYSRRRRKRKPSGQGEH